MLYIGLRRLFTVLILSGSILSGALPDIRKMSLDHKIGQLFIAAAYSNSDDAELEGLKIPFEKYVESLIQDYHIGGLILKHHWTVEEEIIKIQEFQSRSSIPLFICQDCEWGLTQGLPGALRFPQNMTLGAIQQPGLIEAMGFEVGRQCRIVGVNYNFSPCVDVNNNPFNSVIHLRSFGDSPDEVGKRGVAMMKGLQRAGVIACAKHFPGHGDTAIDSHIALPMLPYSQERIRSVELEPFRQMIHEQVISIMIGHLVVPCFETKKDVPASLSKKIVSDLLRDEMGYGGIVITDDLLMKAISEGYEPGEACLQAFFAGNDLILSAIGAIAGIQKIKEAVLEGIIPESEIDRRVQKILQAKVWLQHQPPLRGRKDLFSIEAVALKKQLYESALTITKNRNGIIPLVPQKSDVALLQIGDPAPSPFYEALFDLDQGVPLFIYGEDDLAELQDYQTIIVGFMGMNKFRHKNYGLSEEAISYVDYLVSDHRIIATVFGSPYSLPLIPDVDGVILAYEDDIDAQRGAAKVVFGMLKPTGRLPVKLKDVDFRTQDSSL